MNRRRFLLVGCVSLLPGCAAFSIGWRKGRVCNAEAADTVKVQYGEYKVALIGLLRLSRLEAETEFLKANRQGFTPRSGAVISNALEISIAFTEFMKSNGFAVIQTDLPIEDYKKELCSYSCIEGPANCEWRDEFDAALNLLIAKAKE